MNKKQSLIHNILLWFISITWGGGFVAGAALIDHGFPTFTIILSRFGISALITAVVSYSTLKTLTLKETLQGALGGLFLFFGFALQTLGLAYTTPGNNAFITACGVVLVPFIMKLIYKKDIPRKTYLAVLICFLGILLLNFSFTEGISFSVGDLITLSGTVFFALQLTYVSHIANNMHILKLTFLQFATVGGFALLCILLFERQSFFQADFKGGLPAILFASLICTTLCYFLQFYVQKHVPASKAAIIMSTESVFGAIFSVLLGFEAFRINMVLGGVAILFSVIFLDVDFSKLLKKKQPHEEKETQLTP